MQVDKQYKNKVSKKLNNDMTVTLTECNISYVIVQKMQKKHWLHTYDMRLIVAALFSKSCGHYCYSNMGYLEK